jgi:hypothetical protein
MRRFTGKLLILAAVFCVLAAIAAAQDKAADKPAAAATSEVPGVRGEFLDEVAYYEQRFTRLAEAIPADKYTWRPAERSALDRRGVRACCVRELRLCEDAGH